MRTVDVTLQKGLTIGDTTHTVAVLREPSAGDVIDATEESEKLIPTANGPILIASDALVGAHILRRQIVKLGEYPGPLSLAEMKKLSAEDLARLQTAAEDLEGAGLELATRGRDETPGS